MALAWLRRYTESLVCYKEGLQLFLKVLLATTSLRYSLQFTPLLTSPRLSLPSTLLQVVQAVTDKDKKVKYRSKAEEYLGRSEKVRRG